MVPTGLYIVMNSPVVPEKASFGIMLTDQSLLYSYRQSRISDLAIGGIMIIFKWLTIEIIEVIIYDQLLDHLVHEGS